MPQVPTACVSAGETDERTDSVESDSYLIKDSDGNEEDDNEEEEYDGGSGDYNVESPAVQRINPRVVGGKRFRKIFIVIPFIILAAFIVGAGIAAIVFNVRSSPRGSSETGEGDHSTFILSATFPPIKDEKSTTAKVDQLLPKVMLPVEIEGCPREVLARKENDVFAFKVTIASICV